MFCSPPFCIFTVRPNGNVHVCCAGWLPTSIGNIFQSSAIEIWNSPLAQDVRSSVLDGTFRYCTRCPLLPGPGGPLVEQAPSPRPSLRLDHIPQLRLSYDQTCNLTCPSCRTRPVGPRTEPNASVVARVHEAMLRSGAIAMAQQLFVTGSGDPLASPTYRKLLRDLPALAPHLQVALLTNGQLLDKDCWEEIDPSNDRIVKLGISIDAATPETYRTNRGASWTRLWSNVELANQRRRPGHAFHFYMNYVVQANNFRELIPLVELALSRGIDSINVYFMRDWGTFSKDEYQSRAVHLPKHPEYSALCSVMTDARLLALVRENRVLLPTFPPITR